MDNLFAPTGSMWATTSNIEITGSLYVNGNSKFNGQIEYMDITTYDGDIFVKSGSQMNFNIGDGEDGSYYRIGRKVSGCFGIVQDPGNHHILDISTTCALFKTPVELSYGVTGSIDVTGSVNISNVMNLKPQNPLPQGNIGDLAVSSSNHLYFYNGDWTLVV